MPAEHMLTGGIDVGTMPDGETKAIVVQTGPTDVYVIPLPDEPPAPGQPSPKTIILRELAGGLHVAKADEAPRPPLYVPGGEAG